jgi:hypothetical protein
MIPGANRLTGALYLAVLVVLYSIALAVAFHRWVWTADEKQWIRERVLWRVMRRIHKIEIVA